MDRDHAIVLAHRRIAASIGTQHVRTDPLALAGGWSELRVTRQLRCSAQSPGLMTRCLLARDGASPIATCGAMCRVDTPGVLDFM